MSLPYDRIKTRVTVTRTPIACVLCGLVTANPFIDHCHEHGYTRGLICANCNARMIYVDKDPDSASPAQRFYRDNCPDCRRISGGVPAVPAPEPSNYVAKPQRAKPVKVPAGTAVPWRSTSVPVVSGSSVFSRPDTSPVIGRRTGSVGTGLYL